MNCITQQFTKGPAYVGYLTAGDGSIDRSFEASLALIKGGVNLLEIGVPFSDPIADGPTIQQASQRSLKNGTSLNDIFNLIKKIKSKANIPIILFTYLNPVIAYGNQFYLKAHQAGVDGCLVVDLPLEETKVHYEACIKNQIDPIFLISPSTPKERITKINKLAKGMLYYVCRKGTTGVKSTLPVDFPNRIDEIKSQTKLPIVSGFGISNKAMAKEVLNVADGFVVGSLFVKAIADGLSAPEITQLAKSIDPR